MAYLSATDWVQSLPGIPTITGTSIPLNMSEVATVIARTSAEIDSAAAQAGYTVPIASCLGLSEIEQICEYGAGWKVLRTFFPNVGGPGGSISLASEYRTAYRDAIRALRTGEMPIIGAAKDTSEVGRNLPRSFATSDPIATAGVVPHFDMDQEF